MIKVVKLSKLRRRVCCCERWLANTDLTRSHDHAASPPAHRYSDLAESTPLALPLSVCMDIQGRQRPQRVRHPRSSIQTTQQRILVLKVNYLFKKLIFYLKFHSLPVKRTSPPSNFALGSWISIIGRSSSFFSTTRIVSTWNLKENS